MTLIIGIKCEDGSIIIASDGAATLGSLGTRTALQPTKKLSIFDNKVLVGVSGPMGLGQKISGELNEMWENRVFSGKNALEAMSIISAGVRKHIYPEFTAAEEARKVIGNVALESVLSATLVALPLNHSPELFQLDQQGAAERITSDLPFACIGSGQPIADPFLGFIRRVIWSNQCPSTVNDGLFAAYWTLHHAISLNPGGISLPIQTMAIVKSGNEWEAKEYAEAEMTEHQDAMQAAEDALRDFRKKIQDETEAEEIPQPSEQKLTAKVLNHK